MKSAMQKFAFIFIFVACDAATVKKDLKSTDYSDVNFGAKDDSYKKVCLAEVSKSKLWVLDLNDEELNFKQLRSPDKMDRRVFTEVMEPVIKNYNYQQLSKIDTEDTKQEPSKTKENIEEITKYDFKKQILKMFNKLIMPYQGEPSLNYNLGDNNKVCTKLYFKGPFSSLVIRYKNKRWNYFLSPPSPLPRWFYEKHTNVTHSGQAMYVEIPDDVRNEFYEKFFYMLQGFISFIL